ncbi:MAG: hypothetical protein ACI4SG_06240 [Oligosphaeraceae bacterium]
MNNTPRLRDSKKLSFHELYPLNNIPKEIIVKLCSHFVYLIATGRNDITGNDFGDAIADAFGGIHYASPVGIVDIGLGAQAWSVKTLKCKNVFKAKSVRIITGRNSPDYSYGINDPHHDIQKTGDAVLGIWNERINVAYSKFHSIRTLVLVRNFSMDRFVIFEEDIRKVRQSDYRWVLNKNNNFAGIEKATGKQRFTWQPHGSQFTVHTDIPENAVKFELKRPDLLDKNMFILNLNYNDSWVHILNP